MFGDDDSDGAGRSESPDDGRDVVSVVGAGMEVEGDCRCDGSLRVDGRVEGTIEAGKSVVVGEDGEIEGGVLTQDAVIAGHVSGTVRAESRVELKEGCLVEGDIHSPSVRLEEGGRIDGELDMSGRGDGAETASRSEGRSASEAGRAAAGTADGEAAGGASKAEE